MSASQSNDVHSTRAPEPVGAYPHAKRAGNLLFMSGVGPRKRGTKEIPGVTLGADGRLAAKDIEAQCRSCFDNAKAVMEDAGVPWINLVDVTVFLTDMANDFPSTSLVQEIRIQRARRLASIVFRRRSLLK